ncbi:MerR family transcriptional regulator [Nonomuraea basaltis]|uniref:MerR family transcriptional regulator n=1 Tax=Nonomuraea basaltis TaxID=2495887 RepID=UPI00110C40A1|nr:MerR family transcriptional regulator [Nonomuraea basaltis]TMR97428.1 MerR family transcriptional regulator [Nonomuraea basaltis]
MLVGELARRTNVTVRALRYYEKAGLVVPQRLANGYRQYDPVAVRQVEEIKELTSLGLSVEETRPFVECLASGHASGDECPASLAAYRHAVDQMSRRIERLVQRRDALAAHLEAAAGRAMPTRKAASVSAANAAVLLVEPEDDGAAAHLAGRSLPALPLPATDGTTVDLAALGAGRTVLYLYPLTGRPGVDLPDGWDAIPGARGCTPEACGFRDHHEELREAGAARVFGLSSQSGEYQRELVDRLRLPFRMLADPGFAVRDALKLPTFEADGMILYRRLTMIVRDAAIEHFFYPVFPPDQHAGQVMAWLQAHPEGER